VAESLLEKGHYTWCLFVGHLILEKLLKAIYLWSVIRIGLHCEIRGG